MLRARVGCGLRLRPGWQDFHDRLAVRENGNGPAGVVEEALRPVNAQVPVDGGPQVLRLEGAFRGVFAFGVGRADHLPRAHPATRHQHGHRPGPMVAPGLQHAGLAAHDRGEARRAAKLACHHEQHLLVQSPRVEVLHQRRDGLVVVGEAPSGIIEKVAVDRVRIPIVGAVLRHAATGVFHHDGHKAGARLDESPRHDRPLAEAVVAITLAQLRRFPGDVEGDARLVGGQQLDGLPAELVHRVHQAALVHIAAQAVQAVEQMRTVAEAIHHVRREPQVFDLEAGRARVAHDEERCRGAAEIRGPEAEYVHALPAAVHLGDVVRQAGLEVFAHLRDDGTDHWIVVDEARGLLWLVAGEKALVPAAVVRELVRYGADDRVFVRTPGVHRQQFADFDAGDVRLDGREDATILRRRVRLHVVGLHVRRPSRQPDKNDRRVRTGLARGFLGDGAEPEQVAEAQRARGERANLQEAAARDRPGTVLRCHGVWPVTDRHLLFRLGWSVPGWGWPFKAKRGRIVPPRRRS